MKNTDSRYMYKAKRTDNNVWVHGYLIKLNQVYMIISVDADTEPFCIPVSEIGKTVFLTKLEAEIRLKELRNMENKEAEAAMNKLKGKDNKDIERD